MKTISVFRVLPALVVLAIALSATPAVTQSTRSTLLEDIYPGKEHSLEMPAGVDLNVPFARLGKKVFFWARHPRFGWELWRSNGTARGTRLVKDIFGGTDSSLSDFLDNRIVRMGRKVFFAARDDGWGAELWKSDGSRAGTKLVKNLNGGEDSGMPEPFTNVAGTLFFRAFTTRRGSELWKSDGSRAGTVLVKDIWSGRNGSYPQPLAKIGRTLYFAADHPQHPGLWKSDGTVGGTKPVKDISPVQGVAKVDGVLYFTAGESSTGFELWKSNGTTGGTMLVKDIFPGTDSSNPRYFTRLGDVVLFSAFDPAAGWELWKSDGTESGTVLVEDIFPGPGANHPTCIPPVPLRCVNGAYGLTRVGEWVYFAADHPASGTELWKSDGTADGTVMVDDIAPGEASSSPHHLAKVGRTLYFSADDGASGRELWCSAGGAGSTRLAADVDPQEGSSPFSFTRTRAGLLLGAQDASHGRELHRLPLPPAARRCP